MKVARSTILAASAVLVVAALGAWGWTIDPEPSRRWAFVMFFLPALWGFLELFQGGRRREWIMSWHRYVIAGVGLLMTLDLGFQLAIASDLVDASMKAVGQRASGVTKGLMLAVWGNYLPTVRSPWTTDEEWFDWQRVHRFGGWVASLSGLGIAAAWLAFPTSLAKPISVALVVTFCVLGVGRKFLSVADYARRQPPPALPTEERHA